MAIIKYASKQKLVNETRVAREIPDKENGRKIFHNDLKKKKKQVSRWSIVPLLILF